MASVEWTKPLYTKKRVNAAGRALVDPSATREEREIALAVINNWRSCHGFPLNTLQIALRRYARLVEPDPLVAQRTKRLSSIESKLRRYPELPLWVMQDIGGCRAVVGSVAAVDETREKFTKSSIKHSLVREDDYLRKPKSSGYRGRHLVYAYFSDKNAAWNGRRIEVQIRTQLEHAWATAVETVGTFVGQALKSSQGEEDWLRFFALMGSAIALRENTPVVPGTPEDHREIWKELKHYATSLDIVARLNAYRTALRTVERGGIHGHLFILQLDASDAAESSLVIDSFEANQVEEAQEAYQAIERAIANQPSKDAVLVSAESFTALRRAYPNYFLDTSEFLVAVEEAIA